MMTEKMIFDLHDQLTLDTFLRVKYPKNKWCTYIIPTMRNDGTIRTFGDVYLYFTTKTDFRFAMGMILNETLCGKFWTGKSQYLYFDKKRPPELLEPLRVFTTQFVHPKRKKDL